MSSTSRPAVVVGGGLLGASIARALKVGSPNDQIVWLLGTKSRNTASTDHNKIIRTPYPDEAYVRLAQEALAVWENHECFHKTGWVQAISEGSLRSTRKTPSDTKISIEEYRRMVGSEVAPSLSELEELWLNRNIGYADTAHALQLVVDEVKALGVEVRESDVRRILKNEEGSCQGVEVDAEVPYEILADKTIVSAGPWVPQLLQTSGVPFPKEVLKIVGVVVGILPLNDADMKTLNMDMPISVGEHGTANPPEYRFPFMVSRRGDDIETTPSSENDNSTHF
jgi:sarcosine oxidase / L-pipecolate oxidase